MATVNYTTYLCGLSTGQKPCYAAKAKANGTCSIDEFVKNIAEYSGETAERARYLWDLAMRELANQLHQGNRLELGQLSVGIGVQGTFDSANAQWNPDKNTLVPFVNAKGTLKNALKNVTAKNTTEGYVLAIKSVLDTLLRQDGVIGSGDVYISGTNLVINTARTDEGVWLENYETGEVVRHGTVSHSDATTVNCTFEELPTSGKYYLVVAGRNGMTEDYGVSIARKIVEVING